MRAEAHEWEHDEAVRDLLKRRPEFVREDPELMQALGLRIDASNVIDSRPRRAGARFEKAQPAGVRSVRRHLEAVARANFDAQAQTHGGASSSCWLLRNHADLALGGSTRWSAPASA